MNLLIVSTSTVYGKPYLSYLQEECKDFFPQSGNILFIPFARPSGISHDEYTAKAKAIFNTWGFSLKGAHEFTSAEEGCAWADGFFTGGGNTFLLASELRRSGYFEVIDQHVRKGKPYMGTSAGANITGISICTTNDMPIMYPPSFDAFGWVPFNINPHYIDKNPNSTHMGESRDTRIAEFQQFNDIPVIGLREGSWIKVIKDKYLLRGNYTARLFKPNEKTKEVKDLHF